jgi:hypothetical protein
LIRRAWTVTATTKTTARGITNHICRVAAHAMSRSTQETKSHHGERYCFGQPDPESPTPARGERHALPDRKVPNSVSVSGNDGVVPLAFDGPVNEREVTCTACGREYPLVTAFVVLDGHAHAVAYAACHAHDGRTEVWLDVTIGSFDEPEFADQATFSCRVRETGATLFPGPVAAEGLAPFFGKKLTPEEAQLHPRLNEVWSVVDFVVTGAPTVEAAVYGHG